LQIKREFLQGKIFLHRGENRPYSGGNRTGLQLNQRKDQTSLRKNSVKAEIARQE
jgi:hypothetical protein